MSSDIPVAFATHERAIKRIFFRHFSFSIIRLSLDKSSTLISTPTALASSSVGVLLLIVLHIAAITFLYLYADGAGGQLRVWRHTHT